MTKTLVIVALTAALLYAGVQTLGSFEAATASHFAQIDALTAATK